MQADSRLPEDIRPSGETAATPARRVLLTGATGFLGAYLLRDLLTETEADIWCLVRGTDNDADHRLRANLDQYGLDAGAWKGRVRTISGDLTFPNFGLKPSLYEELSESLDAIFHAAADVNWVLPYEALRHANVIATRELLRLACAARPKAFHLISSLSVCYATGGPLVVREDETCSRMSIGFPSARAEQVHIGVACTAGGGSRIAGLDPSAAFDRWRFTNRRVESRRPGGGPGEGLHPDEGRPDLDWAFDAAPVDYVSRAIVRLSFTTEPAYAPHLHHPAPRHWRECVPWMSLFGYPVQLLSYPEWLERLKVEADRRITPCRASRLFLRRTTRGATVPELYQQSTRSAVAEISREGDAAAGLTCPPPDAELFDLTSLDTTRGFPAATNRGTSARSRSGLPAATRTRASSSACCGSITGPLLRVEQIVSLHLARSQRHQRAQFLAASAAVRAFQVQGDAPEIDASDGRQVIDLVIKAKPSDRDALDVGETVAGICDTAGGCVPYVSRRIGLTASHLREIAIYEQSDGRLQRTFTLFRNVA
jgi:thioester reductase-like protein